MLVTKFWKGIISIALLLVACGTVLSDFKWSHYTPYEITAYNDYERAILYEWSVTLEWLIFLNKVTNQAALNIIILAKDPEKFEKMLSSTQIHWSRANLMNMSANEYSNLTNSRSKDPTKGFLTWKSIETWTNHSATVYRNLEKRILNNTYEKRNIFYLKASTGPKKCAVLVIAGEDSKDWLSVAVTLNFISNLLNDKTKYSSLLDYYDMYFVPVANPDGYNYSMSQDRFWSKNRKAYQKPCVGVNVDRNWFYPKTVPIGSEKECNAVYLGHQSLSEEETRAISEFINTQLSTKLMAFISVKDYGNMITLPYANNEESINHNLMMKMIPAVIDKMHQKYRKICGYGYTGYFLYNMTGNSADWVKKKLNVPVVFTVHLQQEHYIPIPSDIKPATKTFTLIVNETLMLAKNIYGPLFDNQSKSKISAITFFCCILLFSFKFYYC